MRVIVIFQIRKMHTNTNTRMVVYLEDMASYLPA